MKPIRKKCDDISRGIGGLGNVQLVPAGAYLIANIFGQNNYGRDKQYTVYSALQKAFNTLASDCGMCVIRIPYGMGCGLGGGDWKIVSKLIDEELCQKGVCVEIWKLNS